MTIMTNPTVNELITPNFALCTVNTPLPCPGVPAG